MGRPYNSQAVVPSASATALTVRWLAYWFPVLNTAILPWIHAYGLCNRRRLQSGILPELAHVLSCTLGQLHCIRYGAVPVFRVAVEAGKIPRNLVLFTRGRFENKFIGIFQFKLKGSYQLRPPDV